MLSYFHVDLICCMVCGESGVIFRSSLCDELNSFVLSSLTRSHCLFQRFHIDLASYVSNIHFSEQPNLDSPDWLDVGREFTFSSFLLPTNATKKEVTAMTKLTIRSACRRSVDAVSNRMP